MAAEQAFAMPVVVDLDTGIRYMNHAHAVNGRFVGGAVTPSRYPLEPRGDLEIAGVWRGTVTACTLVMVEDVDNQHTMLQIDRADR